VNYRKPPQPNPGYNEDFVVRSAGRLGRRPKGKKMSIINEMDIEKGIIRMAHRKNKDSYEIVLIGINIDIFYE